MTQVYRVLGLWGGLGTRGGAAPERKRSTRGYDPARAGQGPCKCTPDMVMEIRRAHDRGGKSYKQLAEQYGLHPHYVKAICDYTVWSHILPHGFVRGRRR